MVSEMAGIDFVMPKNIAEAKELQEELRDKVQLCPFSGDYRYICGVDVAYRKRSKVGVAAAVVLGENLAVEESSVAALEVEFPYIPGFLSFREVPIILEAIKGLKLKADVFMVDGQGLAHPRGIGLGCHLGLVLGKPTVGVAKSLLVGEFSEPKMVYGDWQSLSYKGKEVGRVVRTRDWAKPVFVSPGHLIDQEGAYKVVMSCLHRYRLPEPTRLAHLVAERAKRERVKRTK
jgi:deoxyribonuclease V